MVGDLEPVDVENLESQRRLKLVGRRPWCWRRSSSADGRRGGARAVLAATDRRNAAPDIAMPTNKQHRWIGSCSFVFLPGLAINVTRERKVEPNRTEPNRRRTGGYARVVCDLGFPHLPLSIRLLYIYLSTTVDSASTPARKGRFGIGTPMVGIGIGRRTQRIRRSDPTNS